MISVSNRTGNKAYLERVEGEIDKNRKGETIVGEDLNARTAGEGGTCEALERCSSEHTGQGPPKKDTSKEIGNFERKHEGRGDVCWESRVKLADRLRGV